MTDRMTSPRLRRDVSRLDTITSRSTPETPPPVASPNPHKRYSGLQATGFNSKHARALAPEGFLLARQ